MSTINSTFKCTFLCKGTFKSAKNSTLKSTIWRSEPYSICVPSICISMVAVTPTLIARTFLTRSKDVSCSVGWSLVSQAIQLVTVCQVNGQHSGGKSEKRTEQKG